MGHFGFSYVGLIYLLILFIPNILWAKWLVVDYQPEHENKVLLWMERIGQVLVTGVALIFWILIGNPFRYGAFGSLFLFYGCTFMNVGGCAIS